MRTFPFAEFSVDLSDLMNTVFSLPPSNAADLCGVSFSEVLAWRDGSKPVPFACYQLLRFAGSGVVPDFMGKWSGWRFGEDRIYPAGDHRGIRWEEIIFIDHYRLNENLVKKQSETIEQLLRQLDFYKRQCSLEARAGLMLANIAGNCP